MYIAKIFPLEPYSFGKERGFEFKGVTAENTSTYFVKSETVPEQTTVFGMLRFAALEQHGKCEDNDFQIRHNMKYSRAEREEIARTIGENSFCFGPVLQDFGKIHKVSPLFLMDDEGNPYISNPFNNKNGLSYASETGNGFEPIKMTAAPVQTSAGSILMPENGEFDAKKGYASGYIGVRDGRILREYDLFQSVFLTGNRKNSDDGSDNDSFFKREAVMMDPHYCFAVYIDAEKGTFPDETICYMGQKRSAFAVRFEETDETYEAYISSLEREIKQLLHIDKCVYYYALSDAYLPENVTYDAFCIVENKPVRNLQTVYMEEQGKPAGFTSRIRRSDRQFNLIRRGSVFYGSLPEEINNENCKKIGYNRMIKIGE